MSRVLKSPANPHVTFEMHDDGELEIEVMHVSYAEFGPSDEFVYVVLSKEEAINFANFILSEVSGE